SQRGVQPTVEQDQSKRSGPEPQRERVVLERDAADSLGTGEHPDHQKAQRARHADAAGSAAEQRRDTDEHSRDEQNDGRRVWLAQSLACTLFWRQAMRFPAQVPAAFPAKPAKLEAKK